MKHLIILPVLATLASGPCARASDVGASPGNLQRQETVAVTQTTSLNSANIDGEGGIEVRATTDSDSGKATVKWSDRIRSEYGKPTYATLAASVPLNKDGDSTRLATFDGFSDAVSLSAGLTLLRYGGSRTPASMGINASVGYRQFEYIDTASIAETKTTKIPASLGVFYGRQVRLFGEGASFAVFGVEYKSEYKPEDSRSILLPPDSDGQEFVRTGAWGPPKSSDRLAVSFDVRRKFRHAKTGFKVTYDLQSAEFAVDIPIMFLHASEEKKWTAGFIFSYQSEEDEIVGAIVVGAPFTIIQRSVP